MGIVQTKVLLITIFTVRVTSLKNKVRLLEFKSCVHTPVNDERVTEKCFIC